MKKKILFTIQWYPSNRSANVLCDVNIIKGLLETGQYEVHCLVYRLKDQMEYEFVDGIHVHRFSRSWLWTEIMDSYKNVNSLKYKVCYHINRFLLRVRQILTIPFYPIDVPFLVSNFKRNAIKLHEKERFDIIVSEHNGIDTLLAGYYVKNKYPEVKYMPIMWDPMVGKEGAKYLPHNYTEARFLKLQNWIFSKADVIVSMTSNKEYLKGDTVLYQDKIHYLGLPRFVRPNIPNPTNNYQGFIKEEAINVLYGGVISNRDIKRFVEICNKTGFDNFNFIFLVSTPTSELEASLKKLNGTYVLHTYIPHDDLIQLMIRCDYVLNIGGTNPRMIPSKIFEYMSYGKPVISTFIDNNDASLVFLEKYPLTCLLDTRIEIEKSSYVLRNFILMSKGKHVEFDDIKSLYSINTPDVYIDLIKSCIS